MRHGAARFAFPPPKVGQGLAEGPFTIDLGPRQMLELDLAPLPLPTLAYLNQSNEYATPLFFSVVNDPNPAQPGFQLRGMVVSEMLPKLPRALGHPVQLAHTRNPGV